MPRKLDVEAMGVGALERDDQCEAASRETASRLSAAGWSEAAYAAYSSGVGSKVGRMVAPAGSVPTMPGDSLRIWPRYACPSSDLSRVADTDPGGSPPRTAGTTLTDPQ